MVNKAILVGRVGKDPEVQTSTSGKTVAKFSLATTEKYKDKETTEWHNIVLWNKLAEIAGKYVNKGSLLYIEGKITTNSWEKDGAKHYKTEIIGNTMKMLSSKQLNEMVNEAKKQFADNEIVPGEEEDSDIPM
jgi:single-strand DNA-binding protein